MIVFFVKKLSFELLQNSAKKVQEYAKSTGLKDMRSRSAEGKQVKDDIETYLRKSGYPPGLAKQLKNALDKGTDILDSDHLPKTWKLCMQYNISLDQFATLPMHLLFLGIEENLLSQTPIIFDCKKWNEAKSWKKLTDRMQRLQKAFDKLSLVCCMSRPFTGPKNIGTAIW